MLDIILVFAYGLMLVSILIGLYYGLNKKSYKQKYDNDRIIKRLNWAIDSYEQLSNNIKAEDDLSRRIINIQNDHILTVLKLIRGDKKDQDHIKSITANGINEEVIDSFYKEEN